MVLSDTSCRDKENEASPASKSAGVKGPENTLNIGLSAVVMKNDESNNDDSNIGANPNGVVSITVNNYNPKVCLNSKIKLSFSSNNSIWNDWKDCPNASLNILNQNKLSVNDLKAGFYKFKIVYTTLGGNKEFETNETKSIEVKKVHFFDSNLDSELVLWKIENSHYQQPNTILLDPMALDLASTVKFQKGSLIVQIKKCADKDFVIVPEEKITVNSDGSILIKSLSKGCYNVKVGGINIYNGFREEEMSENIEVLEYRPLEQKETKPANK